AITVLKRGLMFGVEQRLISLLLCSGELLIVDLTPGQADDRDPNIPEPTTVMDFVVSHIPRTDDHPGGYCSSIVRTLPPVRSQSYVVQAWLYIERGLLKPRQHC